MKVMSDAALDALLQKTAKAGVDGFVEASKLLSTKDPRAADADEFIMVEAVRALSTGYALLLARTGPEEVDEAFTKTASLAKQGVDHVVKLAREKAAQARSTFAQPGEAIPAPMGNA